MYNNSTGATIEGQGNLNGNSKITFQIMVTDSKTKGSPDTLSIKIMNSTGSTIYKNSGDVEGQIKINDKHNGNGTDNITTTLSQLTSMSLVPILLLI